MNIEIARFIKEITTELSLPEIFIFMLGLIVFYLVKEKLIPWIANRKSKSMVEEIYKQRLWYSTIAIKTSGHRIVNHFPIKGKKKEIQEVVFGAIKLTEPFIKEILELNHFDEMSIEEFHGYIDRRKVDILNEMSLHMTTLYEDEVFDGYTRDEWFKNNQEIVPLCFGDIEKWFWACRSLDNQAREKFVMFEIKKD